VDKNILKKVKLRRTKIFFPGLFQKQNGNLSCDELPFVFHPICILPGNTKNLFLITPDLENASVRSLYSSFLR
jgi:hypothetical protein